MTSTFFGLEASKRGLATQQSALYTTGHNISNANTEGYSRQRVNMTATTAMPYPGLNSEQYPGQLGTGVKISSVQRVRDEFIDRQYRQETSKLGYWDSKLNSINQMEDILSEPSEYGINQAFTDFWSAFQDVSTNPEDSAARKVAIAKGEALADAFNYNYTQLETIQGNLGNEIAVSTNDINTILKKIAAINDQVKALEPNGYVTNDLYDARDVLVDKLNEYLPVTIERIPSGGNAVEAAEGSLTVRYNGVVLVEGKYAGSIKVNDTEGKQIDAAFDTNDQYALFTALEVTAANKPGTTTNQSASFSYTDLENANASRGRLLALIDAYGHQDLDNNSSQGIYPDMLNELNKVAATFVEAFNSVHAGGYTLASSNLPSALGGNFFNDATNGPITAKNMSVNRDVIDNPSLLAASSGIGQEGNGNWARELANLQSKSITNGATIGTNVTTTPVTLALTTDLGGFTFQDYYTGLIGDLAVDGSTAANMQYNSQTQKLTVENNRASMSAVSLDEEMTNMITFQQAYNANARMITVVDEMLEKIINGMGRVGL